MDLVFSVYARIPRDPSSFVADTLHGARELGLTYNPPGRPGKYLFQAKPGAESVVVEEKEPGDPRGSKFARAVEALKDKHWPHVWMAVEIPREERGGGERTSTLVPVTLAVREMPRSGPKEAWRPSGFCEVTLSLPVSPLVDVEREEDAEQGLHWFVAQVFMPLLISREALFGKADFDPSSAREVTLKHLEKLQVPDLYLLNFLGTPYVRAYGVEPFLNPVFNPPDLQRRWLMRTPEGALLFRAKVEADRWNGSQEPPVDFYDWAGRFRLIEGIKRKGRAPARGAHS